MMISITSLLLAAAPLASAASLQQVTNFGSNPTSINMHIYVPDKVAAKAPVIVAVSFDIPKTLSFSPIPKATTFTTSISSHND
jgi:hypothetical protein